MKNLLENLKSNIIFKNNSKELLKEAIINNSPYVYVHWLHDVPIYIGEGKNRRAITVSSSIRSEKWLNVFKNKTVLVEVILCKSTKEALDLEKELSIKYKDSIINLYGRYFKGSYNPNSKEKRKGSNPLSFLYYRYDLSGNFIDKGDCNYFENLGFNPNALNNSINRKGYYKGFLFTIDNKNIPKYKPSITSPKKVIRINKTTKETKEYESIQATCVDGFNPKNVSQVITGKKNTHRGYFWKKI